MQKNHILFIVNFCVRLVSIHVEIYFFRFFCCFLFGKTVKLLSFEFSDCIKTFKKMNEVCAAPMFNRKEMKT